MLSRALVFAENIVDVKYFKISVIKGPEEVRKRSEAAVLGKQPDVSCVYTESGQPRRNIVDDRNQKSDSPARLGSIKDFISPLHANSADFPYGLEEYQKVMCNHAFTAVLETTVTLWEHLLTTAEAYIPALTDREEWSRLQLVIIHEYAELGVQDTYLLKLLPLLDIGLHTVLEGFCKYELVGMKDNAKLLAGKTPADEANLVDLNED
ncbi:hypothetical protein H0G86_003491 [Trichoderma simmonsii]|uniref:Uncharacterized protein n=1 Tax=Trichoderma simmonsii TaxID=1491479 RepID=A0A8G0L5M6_9HYPO|nr:hypothetical protein H0G86_003491 [Trichoderma simmonsii]